MNTVFTAAMLSVGLVSAASGAQTINLTGSPILRSNVFNVLSTGTAAGGVFDSTPSVIATFGNSDPTRATWMQFFGNINGTATYINCYWTGSEAGLVSVAHSTLNNAATGLPLSGAGKIQFLIANGTIASGINAGNPSPAQTNTPAVYADFALTDNSVLLYVLYANSGFASAVTNYGNVAVVPYTWVKNVQTAPLPAWTNLVNIEGCQAELLLAFPQLAQPFTGHTSDTNNYVYAIGGDPGFGPRDNFLIDGCNGYGFSTPVVQFAIGGFPTFTNGNATTLLEVDNNGYDSGGDIASALGVDGSQTAVDPNFGTTGYIALGYLGITDASTANIATNWLSFGGVFESNATVETGQYHLWSYEHLYESKSDLPLYQDFGNRFTTALGNNVGGSVGTARDPGIQLKFMQCQKLTDESSPTSL